MRGWVTAGLRHAGGRLVELVAVSIGRAWTELSVSLVGSGGVGSSVVSVLLSWAFVSHALPCAELLCRPRRRSLWWLAFPWTRHTQEGPAQEPDTEMLMARLPGSLLVLGAPAACRCFPGCEGLSLSQRFPWGAAGLKAEQAPSRDCPVHGRRSGCHDGEGVPLPHVG